MISNGSDPARRGRGNLLRLGDPEQHFWLVRSVARVMDVNIGEAVMRGDLECEDYRAMVNRCRQCLLVKACQDWLARSCGHADVPPEGCVIATDLNRLKTITTTKGAY